MMMKNKEKNLIYNLGITSVEGKSIFLFSKIIKSREALLQIASGEDGFSFKIWPENPKIWDEKNGKEENIKKCKNFQIVRINGEYFLTYKRLTRKDKHIIYGAISNDLIYWKKIGKLSKIKENGAIVADYKYKNKYVLYFGESSIKVAFSKNLKTWKVLDKVLLEPRENYFDNSSIEVGNCFITSEGICLIYNVKDNEGIYHSIGAALFDKNDPTRLLWRSNEAIWKKDEKWKDKKIQPIGTVQFNGNLISYWDIEEGGIKAIILPAIFPIKPPLERFKENPVIQPIFEHSWESQATFNPAAVYEGGKVHIVYRAIGDDGISVLGYASSKDGIHIDERLKEPIFKRAQTSGNPKEKTSWSFCSPVWGWGGGCEDPRITKIDDKFYLTYVDFDGTNPPRIALTSIKVDDFLNKRWNWEKPVIISPPGVVDKSACILPEKIKGKYVIFHRIFPNILIDFVDDLNFGDGKYLKGEFSIGPREGYWDSRKVGAGAPPIKTKDGWLLIYYAVDNRDEKYKIGAMLLDLNDPTKVLYRSNKPILEPTEDYENIGKPGVVYPCGAVVVNNQLFVYYGGADRVVCVATKNLDEFLDQLKHSEPKLEPVMIQGF
jgi:predicted GH43/DUF377 family glycosyl hydrolase